MNRLDCEKYILEVGFPHVLKSGCVFCPFNSLPRWDYVQENYPEGYMLAEKVQSTSKHYKNGDGMLLIRNNQNHDDLCGKGYA
jgi:hypothetical protein